MDRSFWIINRIFIRSFSGGSGKIQEFPLYKSVLEDSGKIIEFSLAHTGCLMLLIF